MNEEEKVREAIKTLVQRLGPHDWLLVSPTNTVLGYRDHDECRHALGEDEAIKLLIERERDDLPVG